MLYVFFKTGRMDIFLFYCGVIPFASYYYLRRTSLGKPGIWMVLTCLIAFLPSLAIIAIDLQLSKQGISYIMLSEHFMLALGTMLAGLIVGWILYAAIRNNDVKDSLFAGIALIFVTSSVGALGWSIRLPIAGLLYLIAAYLLVKKATMNKWFVGGLLYIPWLIFGTLFSWILFNPRTESILYDLMNPISIILAFHLNRISKKNNGLIRKIVYILFLTVFYILSFYSMETLILRLNLKSMKPFIIYNENTFKSKELMETLEGIPEHKGYYYFFYIYKTGDTSQFKVLESIDSIRKNLELNTSLVMLKTSQKNESNDFNEKADYFMNEFSAHMIEVSSDQSEKLENLLNIKAYPHISVTNDSLRILFNDQLVSKRQIDSLVTKVVRYSKR